MLYEFVRFADLSDDDISAWKSIISDDISLFSPFFEPAFTRVVSEVRNDVWIVLGREDGELKLIWPMQKAGRVAEPVGAPFSDYHGPIVAAGADFDPEEMINAVDLSVIRMTGVHDPSCRLHNYAQEIDGAFVVDVRKGVDSYFATQRELYSRHAKKQRRIKRKMEREVGPISFGFDDRNEEHWSTLMRWKQRQYNETGRHNVLGPKWVQDMLHKLWKSEDADCGGYLHTLTHEGRLVAAEFNLGNKSTIHGWVPSYDPEFHSYSPGNMLQDFIIEGMEGHGLSFYDLGVSAGHYKKYYVEYQIPVIRGAIRSSSVMSTLGGANERLWLKLEDAHIPKVSHVMGQIRRRYEIIRSAEPSFSGRMAGVASAAKNVVSGPKRSSELPEDTES